ncbi:MAG: hypothetical protein COY66_01900 [Candidatus Kerfeldbacteria bacterium CG_4_10_14_0_8_um_filter_42_10]|uniref:Uncharacterized protein n=1 Tax=Candidatus Kerfeldbacteria bacterium CG_4_10_14_0_8_um_filter_42_10 TaxID=2014248 RepID=A0A2M7RKT3_9BACT|nr:MAG: hypothetical protein COY66_01900 [Candidatus Kerfeldbacteria bacterium CG_4_10_14_0_8_um_filter_42_10]
MKRGLITTLVIIVSTFVTAGLVYAAATHNVTSNLGGISGDAFDLDGTMIIDSLKVGAQGVGGVTFFNGTIINNTTDNGADNPITFGDNVRIDGRIYRGATAGTSDSQPFIVNDNMEVVGSLTVDSLSGSGIVSTDNLANDSVTTAKINDGTIATADLADSSITSAKISNGTIATADLANDAVTQGVETALTTSTNTTMSGADFDTLTSLSITTGDSSLFCTWSGYGDTPSNPGGLIRVQMLLDNILVNRTIRITRTSTGITNAASLETHAILSVEAGTHTVAMQWNTDTMANMYANTLDCLELKK